MTHSHYGVVTTTRYPRGYLSVVLWCLACAEVAEVPDGEQGDVCAFCPEFESGLVMPRRVVTQC